MASPHIILHYENGRTKDSMAASYNARQQLARLRELQFPVGTRVRLVALAQNRGGFDDRPNLPPGSTGIVTAKPDAMGSLPIKWDHGSMLSATADDELTPA